MRKTLVIAFLVLSAGTVAGFSASLNVEDRKASKENPARFSVNVENDAAASRVFLVSVNPFPHWFYVEGPELVEPGDNHTFDLEVTPPEDALQQNYRFSIHVRDGEESREITEYFTVERPHDLVIKSTAASKSSYRPGETVEYTVELANTASTGIDNYTVKAELLGETSRQRGLPLDGGSSVLLNFKLEVPEGASPGQKNLRLSIIRDGEVRQTVTQSVNVHRDQKIERSTETENRVLFYTRTIEAENQGNTPLNATLNATVVDYLMPVTRFSSRPDSSEPRHDSTVHTWRFRLEPGEIAEVSYTVNYWIPAAALVAVFGGLILLKKLRTGVSIHKKARDTADGVKIHLELENRANEPLHNVKLKDFVPDIASVDEDFSMARPIIRKTPNGTRLTWEIDELEPGDQRVFEYTIHPLFEVEEKVTLPGAELEAGNRKLQETDKVNAEFKPDDT